MGDKNILIHPFDVTVFTQHYTWNKSYKVIKSETFQIYNFTIATTESFSLFSG